MSLAIPMAISKLCASLCLGTEKSVVETARDSNDFQQEKILSKEIANINREGKPILRVGVSFTRTSHSTQWSDSMIYGTTKETNKMGHLWTYFNPVAKQREDSKKIGRRE